MKTCAGWMAAGSVLLGGAAAEELVVVHDAGGTVDAGPYVLRAEVTERQSSEARRVAEWVFDEGVGQAPAAFPVDGGAMRWAAPRAGCRESVTREMFVVGSDERSLRWLREAGDGLRKRGALGVVVDAPTRKSFEKVANAAARYGLEVEAVSGQVVAEGFDVTTYPFLLEPCR